jgi:hypothetical protein
LTSISGELTTSIIALMMEAVRSSETSVVSVFKCHLGGFQLQRVKGDWQCVVEKIYLE